MSSNVKWVVVMSAGLALAGCSPQSGNGRAATTTKTSNGPTPTVDMSVADASQASTDLADPKCGVQNFMLQKGLPPEVMIVLDRSASMSSSLNNGTRWSEVTGAVEQVVSALQGQIGWGLTIFPSDSDCGTSSSVDVQIATMNATSLNAKIGTYSPDGNTPTAAAIKNAATYMASRTTANPKYLLLSTDGEPNCSALPQCVCVFGGTVNSQGQCCTGGSFPICLGPCTQLPAGGDDLTGATQAITDAATGGVHTFIVGVAADSSDNDSLNQLATAGAEPRSGSTKYYPVGSESDLVSAVNTIASQIISCSFGLSTPPPSDLSLVEVQLNGTDVPRDTTHAAGWDFGPGNGSILFYGSACTTLQAQSGSMVKAIYNCAPVQ